MTVKKLEIPAYDPRASFTQALGYMTSPSGACHLRGGYAVSLAFFGGAKEIPRFSLLQSPIAIRNMQNTGILQDSLGVCRFTGYAFSADPWARMVSGVTGRDFSVARLEEIENRVATLERLFNIEAGATAEDDALPARFADVPIVVEGRERRVSPGGPGADARDYYGIRGWDGEGRPTPELRRRPADRGEAAMSAAKWTGERRAPPRCSRPSAGPPCSTTSRTATAATWPSDGPNERGEDEIVITATGSQKGDLEPSQICFLSATETDYGYYKASSETDIHARILALPGVRASMHAHIKELIHRHARRRAQARRSRRISCRSIRSARHHLGAAVPVDWFAVPSGSPEMARVIPERLARPPADDHLRPRGHGQGPDAAARRSSGSASATTPGPSSGSMETLARRRRRRLRARSRPTRRRAFAAPPAGLRGRGRRPLAISRTKRRS